MELKMHRKKLRSNGKWREIPPRPTSQTFRFANYKGIQRQKRLFVKRPLFATFRPISASGRVSFISQSSAKYEEAYDFWFCESQFNSGRRSKKRCHIYSRVFSWVLQNGNYRTHEKRGAWANSVSEASIKDNPSFHNPDFEKNYCKQKDDGNGSQNAPVAYYIGLMLAYVEKAKTMGKRGGNIILQASETIFNLIFRDFSAFTWFRFGLLYTLPCIRWYRHWAYTYGLRGAHLKHDLTNQC